MNLGFRLRAFGFSPQTLDLGPLTSDPRSRRQKTWGQPPSAVRRPRRRRSASHSGADELKPLKREASPLLKTPGCTSEAGGLGSEVGGPSQTVRSRSLVRLLPRTAYFLNRFSNAVRASFGRKLAGVDVSFSRVTRISYSAQSLRTSFLAIRSLTGCMHSKRLPGSK